MIKIKHLLLMLVFVIASGISIICQAQPGDPPPPEIPIDGGISLLIIAGALLGAKKIYDISKKEN